MTTSLLFPNASLGQIAVGSRKVELVADDVKHSVSFFCSGSAIAATPGRFWVQSLLL